MGLKFFPTAVQQLPNEINVRRGLIGVPGFSIRSNCGQAAVPTRLEAQGPATPQVPVIIA